MFFVVLRTSSQLASVGVGEAVVVGLLLRVDGVTEVVEGLGVLEVPCVADPLEEQDWEHLRLEVRRVDRSAEAVGGFPQAGFELLLCEDGHRGSCHLT
jgi:hypothetical protein